PGSLGPAQAGLVYMHVIIPRRGAIPRRVDHRLSVTFQGQTITQTSARTRIDRPTALVLAAPPRAPRHLDADGCCDAPRHVRSTLPLNGQRVGAQRFAIDWERLDEQGRIYVGDPRSPASYVIYGQPIHAAAPGRVVVALD